MNPLGFDLPHPFMPGASPLTYDVLLDPERAFGDMSDFFAVFHQRD